MGATPVLCKEAFLPSITAGFSHEIIVPAVTATNMAWSKDFESFMCVNYGLEYIFLIDSNICRNVAGKENNLNEVKKNLVG